MAAAAQRSPLLAAVATMVALLLRSEAAQTPTGAQETHNDTAEEYFVRRSCSSTLYPSLCYATLSPFAGTIAQDPTRLALAAANVSLARVSSACAHVSSLRRASVEGGRVGARTVSALKDCEESLGDAADLTRQAAGELASLATAEGPEVAWRVSNAQTWMSAALTNEDSCMDGFTGAPPSAAASGETGAAAAPPGPPSVEEEACGRVRQAEQHTSNALALVNGLVGD